MKVRFRPNLNRSREIHYLAPEMTSSDAGSRHDLFRPVLRNPGNLSDEMHRDLGVEEDASKIDFNKPPRIDFMTGTDRHSGGSGVRTRGGPNPNEGESRWTTCWR
jgi:hypothetical protein